MQGRSETILVGCPFTRLTRKMTSGYSGERYRLKQEGAIIIIIIIILLLEIMLRLIIMHHSITQTIHMVTLLETGLIIMHHSITQTIHMVTLLETGTTLQMTFAK